MASNRNQDTWWNKSDQKKKEAARPQVQIKEEEEEATPQMSSALTSTPMESSTVFVGAFPLPCHSPSPVGKRQGAFSYTATPTKEELEQEMGPDNCKCTGIHDCSLCQEKEVRYLGSISPQIRAVETIEDMKTTFIELTRQIRRATEVDEHKIQCIIKMGLEDTTRKVRQEITDQIEDVSMRMKTFTEEAIAKLTHEVDEKLENECSNQIGHLESLETHLEKKRTLTESKIRRLQSFLQTVRPMLTRARDGLAQELEDFNDLSSDVFNLLHQQRYQKRDVAKMGTSMLKISEAVRKTFTALNSLFPDKTGTLDELDQVIKDLAKIEKRMSWSPQKRICVEAEEESEEEAAAEREQKKEKGTRSEWDACGPGHCKQEPKTPDRN